LRSDSDLTSFAIAWTDVLAKSSQSFLSATASGQAPLDLGEAQSTRNLASLRGRFTEAGVATQRSLARASSGVDR
jgi:hypothetical protein